MLTPDGGQYTWRVMDGGTSTSTGESAEHVCQYDSEWAVFHVRELIWSCLCARVQE